MSSLRRLAPIFLVLGALAVPAAAVLSQRQDARASHAEACTERLLERADPEPASVREEAVARAYVDSTYCTPFDRRGWVNENGTVDIQAHLFVQQGGSSSCEVAVPRGAPKEVSCDHLRADVPMTLDCALLHVVPRAQVAAYVRGFERRQRIGCDDGTPLSALGVP